jgi:hypothetical protein
MTPDGHPVPLDQDALLHPSIPDALATAGSLIHWVTSDPELVAAFSAYVEHCPGDLAPALAQGVLAATHDLLAPLCADPIPPFRPATPGAADYLKIRCLYCGADPGEVCVRRTDYTPSDGFHSARKRPAWAEYEAACAAEGEGWR